MIKNKEITPLEHSRVKLSLTIEKEAAAREYAGILGEYSKKIQLPGFRKGKVPSAVLERKFGDSLRAETIQKIIEGSLKSAFEEIAEKPLPYAVPELQDDYKLSLDEDFTFVVAYDIFPKLELGPYTGLSVERPSIKITGDDLKRELDAIVAQNSFVVEKDGAAEKDNMAVINCWELDGEGTEIPHTRKTDLPLTVGAGNDLYGIDDELAGMKKGETKNITKTYPPDYRDSELAGKTKRFAVELTALRENKKPELDDELAQDVSESYKTLDDLKADIEKRLQKTAEQKARSMTIDALMNQVLESTPIDLPESMICAEMDRMWRQFIGRFRDGEQIIAGLLAKQGKSKEEIFETYRPNAEKTLKIQLCIQKMIENEKIEVSEEELDNFFLEDAGSLSMTSEEMKTYYEKNGLTDMVRQDLKEKKLFDLVFDKNTLTTGREMSLTDGLEGGTAT
ncbi:MAG: trigger factor [Spirochaetales bacterium]|nr:trigger factor [Spirochaetales bacterium]